MEYLEAIFLQDFWPVYGKNKDLPFINPKLSHNLLSIQVQHSKKRSD